MSLTAKDVAEITRLLEESSFDDLYLEMDGWKLSLRRGPLAPAAESAAMAAPRVAANTGARPAGLALATDLASGNEDTHAVRAPMLGTFFRAPKPGTPPYVEIGSPVEPDSIIGIIEVMKLMNTVRAGVRGTVQNILGQDGALVEYGETLLHVTKTS